MNKTRQLLLTLFTSVITVGILLFTSEVPAHAGTGIVKTVVNADGGVYWRSKPDWNTPIVIAWHGVYNGDQVELECFVPGGTVPPFWNNPLWYQAQIVSGFGIGAGLVNDHFINSGTNQPNIPVGNVPACSTTQTPPPVSTQPAVHAVYFSPSAGESSPAGGTAVKTVKKDDWSNPNVQCDTSRAIGQVDPTATTLGAWSIGRLGPIYTLARASAIQKQQINYILMIDPGGYKQMKESCDAKTLQPNNQTAGQLLASWLHDNPSARLVILAGNVTDDPLHPVNGYGHAGIQNFYFNDIRAAGESARSRTLICNYSVQGTNIYDNKSVNHSHQVMYNSTNQFIQGAPLTSCPTNIPGVTYQGYWHP